MSKFRGRLIYWFAEDSGCSECRFANRKSEVRGEDFELGLMVERETGQSAAQVGLLILLATGALASGC
ncbi:MAG TPA: hypothetical protein DCF63_03990 [Planctomycetaceae bacterium]|nr:hypothetical protein [Planctomycetaceae bacterium]